MWQNKRKNSKCEKIQKSQNVTKLKNSKCDKTKKSQIWQKKNKDWKNLKTQNMINKL